MAALIKSAGHTSDLFVLEHEEAKAVQPAAAPAARVQQERRDPEDAPRAPEPVQAGTHHGDEPHVEVAEPIDFDALREAHQKRIDALEAEAVQRGFAQGLEEGRTEGREEYAAALRRLDGSMHGIATEAEQVVRAAEDMIAEIVFTVVGRIVGTLLTTREGVHGLVAEATAQVRRNQIVGIRMSSRDIELIAAQHGSEMDGPLIGGVPIEADDTIAMGGCVVEIKGGSLDARIETQFRQFAQTLKELRAKR